MLNRAIAKFILLAFWGAFFQCQSTHAYSKASLPASSSSTPAGFCKKKLTDGQSAISQVTIDQAGKKLPFHPGQSDYLSLVVDYLLAWLSIGVETSRFTSNGLSCWLTTHLGVNANKAPPVYQLA